MPRNRERRKPKTVDAGRRRELDELRLRTRGFSSIAEYRSWCRAHDLPDHVDKNGDELDAERRARAADENARALEARRKVSRNPSDAIRRMFEGERLGHALPPALQVVEARFASARGARHLTVPLRDLLVSVARVGGLLRQDRGFPALGAHAGNTMIEGVCNLAVLASSWVRRPEEWRPRSHNTRRQFGDLARHLLAKYPVPSFLDSVFFEGTDANALRHQCWFAHVGAGKNIRTADLPVKLGAKAAHHFLDAPADLTALEAIRFGQALAAGCNPRVARAILQTRLRQEFDADEFWLSVFTFFGANPMLDPAWVGPVIDYLAFIKLGPYPPEPGFTMKGRTVASLLRRVEEWHEHLGRQKKHQGEEWRPSGLPSLIWDEGSVEEGTRTRWWTLELTTAKELIDEGRAMHHCVGTYVGSCSSGRVSIWSLRKEDATGAWRMLTIEVEHSTRRIVQARAIYDALGDATSKRMLKKWADHARLETAGWV